MSTQTGNAGEHYVMACLLARGIHAGLADRGNPHFDILVRTKAGEFRALRVKTSSGSSFQWSAKGEWDPLPGFDKDNPDPRDITVLVALNGEPPGPKTEIYVVPTIRLVEDLNRMTEHYYRFPSPNGKTRKRTPRRALWLDRKKKPDNIAYAFRDDWRDFRDGWHLINSET